MDATTFIDAVAELTDAAKDEEAEDKLDATTFTDAVAALTLAAKDEDAALKEVLTVAMDADKEDVAEDSNPETTPI